MAKDVIGYKVVSRDDDGTLRSCRVHRPSPWCLTYEVGTRTEGRDGTPVLAFKSKRDAFDFAYSYQPIYKASLENPRQINRLVSLWVVNLFRRFWDLESPPDWDSTMRAPSGTYACDAVTLLEEV